MATKKEEGGFGTLLAVIAIVAALGTWMVISPGYLMKALTAEREFSSQLGGHAADQWIYSKMLSTSIGQVKGIASSIKETQTMPTTAKELGARAHYYHVVVGFADCLSRQYARSVLVYPDALHDCGDHRRILGKGDQHLSFFLAVTDTAQVWCAHLHNDTRKRVRLGGIANTDSFGRCAFGDCCHWLCDLDVAE